MQTVPAPAEAGPDAQSITFTFGDPVPVLDSRDLLDLYETAWMGDYYEPPVSLAGLAKLYRANQHHASAIQVKRNIILSCYIPHPLLSYSALSRLVLDLLIFGNGYLEAVRNRLGGIMQLRTLVSKTIRRKRNPGEYLQLVDGYNRHHFAPGAVIHLQEEDVNQEVYGVPEYLAALQSILLNEAATLFRCKYYKNGSHAGFIMYMTDSAHNQADIEAMRTALKEARGPGNFRNLFMYSPNGKPDGLKVIPVAEVAAKDEFLSIKNVTRDDVLAAHRVPPQLMGLVPNNTGGFGNPTDAARVFARNELMGLMRRLEAINEIVGMQVVSFKEYEI